MTNTTATLVAPATLAAHRHSARTTARYSFVNDPGAVRVVETCSCGARRASETSADGVVDVAGDWTRPESERAA